MPNPDGDQQHTAIVLSGGGAKGSFEVGALLALREIWNEVRPCIVCGTFVGAINALAVAESLDGYGINKLQTIWLGLQRPVTCTSCRLSFNRSPIKRASLGDMSA